MASTPLFINWRDGEFSDWTCTLGNAKYNLHKIVLASSRRSSGFFKGAFNEGFEAAGTDLTKLLPPSCHEYMESALDFVYGGDVTFTVESALALCKIADVLTIDSLMESSLAAIRTVYEGKLEQFELALRLELPNQMVEELLQRVPVEDVLEMLAERPTEPRLRMLLHSCAKKLRIVNPQEVPSPKPGVDCTTCEKALRVKLSGTGVQRLHKSSISTNGALCRVRADCLEGSGPIIGVSKLSANASFVGCPDGGFATKAGCWGLCLGSGNLFAEGTRVSCAGKNSDHFRGKVIRMRMDRLKRVLEFRLENGVGGGEVLGSISAAFDLWDDLVFTVSACSSPTHSPTQYSILQMDV